MHAHRRHRSLAALVAASVALAAGATTAQGGGTPVGQAPRSECAASPEVRHARSALGPGSAARSVAIHSYDDYIEDVVSPPDICASNVVTNDNVTFTIVVHVHDRSTFAPLDAYSILLDTDSNPATGGSRDADIAAGPNTSSTSSTARRA